MGKKSSIRTTISKRRGGVFKTTFAVLSLLVATFVLLLAFRREERSAVSSLSSSEEEKEDDHVTNQFLREAFEEEKEISSDIEYHTYSIVNSYPHDTNAFTQGFLYHSASESFFESTGSVPHGKLSDVRRADIETGEVLELKTIPESAFGEGLVFMREETKRAKKNSLIQLVWKSSRAFTHEIKDIGGKVEEKNNALKAANKKMFNTDLRDGWGVTSSKREGVIVISNGTAHLTLFDMNKGESIGFITVHDNGVEQRFPNELEAVRGEIWANILEKECVARIDERTGKVLGWIDFTGLKKLQDNVGSVMNGIAYDERRDRIFVTGKQWRRVFEVKISKGSRQAPPRGGRASLDRNI
ncbi:unnamed protein product [Bathycoccus prasinos]